MAAKDHPVEPTATASVTAAAISAAFPTSFADIRNASSTLALSARNIFQFPRQLATQFDRLLLQASRQLLRTTARVVGEVAMPEAARDAAGQPGAAAGGWRQALGEAFQLSNTRSYWGMLHYITSRWAFTTFSLVSAD